MNEEKISKSDGTEQVVSMCRRLAQLYICFAKGLAEKLDERRGGEVILEPISRYGQVILFREGEHYRKRGHCNSTSEGIKVLMP